MLSNRYCPSHYRSWLVPAHKSMNTASIFSHLLSRARPIFGADQGTASSQSTGGGEADATTMTPLVKRSHASSKRRTALARVIDKTNRKHRNHS